MLPVCAAVHSSRARCSPELRALKLKPAAARSSFCPSVELDCVIHRNESELRGRQFMIRRFRQHVKRSSLVTEVLESVDPHGCHLNMYSRTAYTQILRLMISAATAERTGANT